MANKATYEFILSSAGNVSGKKIVEAGIGQTEYQPKPSLMRFVPTSYVGIDSCPQPGVDLVADVTKIRDKFPPESLDIVIAQELLEHVFEWKEFLRNATVWLKPGGSLILTTRSPGFRYHPCPGDYWRFTKEIFETVFSDWKIERIENDPIEPGIMIWARKIKVDTTIIDIEAIKQESR